MSILIFPEGHRSEHGEIGVFQPGIGMMASKLRMPVVPIRLEGLDRVLHRVEHAVRALLPERAPASRSDAA